MKLIIKQFTCAYFLLFFANPFLAIDKNIELTEKEKLDTLQEEKEIKLDSIENKESEEEQALHYTTLTGNNQPEPQRAKKRRDAIELIEKAVVFFKKNDVLTCAQAFSRSPAWRKGDLEVRLICKDEDICFSSGEYRDLVWKNATQEVYLVFNNDRNPLKESLEAARGDGWVYQYISNEMKESYVRAVIKGEKTYLLSTGFYTSSVDFTASILVRSAAKELSDPTHNPLEEISNPHGKYVAGNLAVAVYTLDGDCIAHGKSRALIGQNRLDLKDSNRKPFIAEMIDKVKNGSTEGFMSAVWNNIPIKIMYKAVKSHWNPLTPYESIDTLIVMSYYNLEESGKRNLRDLLSEAIKHFEIYGLEKSFKDFSNPKGKFTLGGMHIEVYNMNGKCLANGESPALVNLNLLNQRDKHSNYIVKDLIQEVKRSRYALKSAFYKNANKLYYAKLVEGIEGEYIIAACFYIHSKVIETTYLVKAAINFLDSVFFTKALSEFTNRSGSFFRGDLAISVYREDGTCLVDGMNSSIIWEKVGGLKDEKGYPILKRVIDQANAGGGWTSFPLHNGKKYVYSQAVDVSLGGSKKERFIVSSGYYL